MHECPPFNGYASEEVFDTYPKDDVQKYPYRVSKERRNANFQKKGKKLINFLNSLEFVHSSDHIYLEIILTKIFFMEQLQ